MFIRQWLACLFACAALASAQESSATRLAALLARAVWLEPEPLRQSIEVTARPPLLQAERGGAGFLVERRRLAELPLNGRSFVPLVALAPGVNLPPGSSLPRINGSRPRTSEYLYDGVSVLQPEPGQVAYLPILDAIEEFKVETNGYPAEYGRANGGIILLTQKSGGNHLHGTLFEYLRNERLNARNAFAAAGPKPAYRRHQYGFVLGGPLRRNRTYFFTGWQGTRQDAAQVRLSTVPGTAERGGAFRSPVFDPATTRSAPAGYSRDPFPGGIIPTSRFDPEAVAWLRRYPAVETPAANNYSRTATESNSQDQADLRIDHHASPAHRWFVRYSRWRDTLLPVAPLPDGSGAIASGATGNTHSRAGSLAAEHTWTLSPSRTNQLRLGYTTRAARRTALAGSVPGLELTGYQLLGAPPSASADSATAVTQLVNQFAWQRGRHSLKLGADLRRQALDAFAPVSPAGYFQFSPLLTAALNLAGVPQPGSGHAVASFLLGQVQRYQADVQDEVLRPRARSAEFYAQYDWRVLPSLALNAGVRYTLNFPSTVAGDRGAVFDLSSQRLEFLGRDGAPRTARRLEKANLGPRLGFAWQPARRFVLRGAYGLTWIEQSGITTPFTTPIFPFIRTLEQGSLDNRTPAFLLSSGPPHLDAALGPFSGLGQGVFAVQRDQPSGYAQQWNFSLQRTWGAGWSAEAGYLGSKLTNLGVPDVNLNQLRVEQLSLGAALTAPVANPALGRVPAHLPLGQPLVARQQALRSWPAYTAVTLYRNNVGHSTYHSLQTRLERRLSAGLTFSLAYTFSRLIDDAGAVFDAALLSGPVAAYQAADSHNRRLEKDVSTGNIPHIVSGGFVWQLPAALRAWQLAGLLRLQSGSPLAVTQQPNHNAFAGFGILRPMRLAGPSLPAARRTPARWFDTAAFAATPPFAIGDSSRNPVIGPPFRTLDLVVGRTFALGDRLRLEFRAEAFNLLNTPVLNNPSGAFGTPGFGAITSAQDPRVFELVWKVRF